MMRLAIWANGWASIRFSGICRPVPVWTSRIVFGTKTKIYSGLLGHAYRCGLPFFHFNPTLKDW